MTIDRFHASRRAIADCEVARSSLMTAGICSKFTSDGGNQRVISAPGRNYIAGLDWSPDGRWVVVRSGELPRVELIRVDTGETLPLPFSTMVEEPAWRPR